MAAPCTEHLFFTGRKGVGKSTLVRAAIEGKRVGGFFTKRVEGVLERPSVHLLRAETADVPSAENLLFCCGGSADIQRFEQLGCGALADTAGCDGRMRSRPPRSGRRCCGRWTGMHPSSAFCSRRRARFCVRWRRIRTSG